MKKVVITAFGDESTLAIVEADLPDPAPGEVQLAVEYTIVSGSDVNMRRGTYPLQKKPPLTPGYSVIGKVRLNGEGCPSSRSMIASLVFRSMRDRLAFTLSQAISRFFRLHTLSINEWTFFAPAGLIQSTSLLGRGCTGFSLMELILLHALTHWSSLSSQPSSSAAFPDPFLSPVARSHGFHHASGTFQPSDY
jgi:NADPH:quinone reductase-like Zn-dependent oxidoreductase